MKETIAKALTMMRFAGLADYGRYPTNRRHFDVMIAGYCGACRDRNGVTEREVEMAAEHCCSRMAKFPSAAEFADVCAEMHEQTHYLVCVPQEDGRSALVSVPRGLEPHAERSAIALACKDRGLPVPPPELPVSVLPTEEIRNQCWARLEAAEQKWLDKQGRRDWRRPARPLPDEPVGPDRKTDEVRERQIAALGKESPPDHAQDEAA